MRHRQGEALEMESRPRVDLSRYPIESFGSPEREGLVASCRRAIGESGACVLEGFVPSGAVTEIAREVEPCLDRAFYKTKRHNVYLVDDDPAYPADHPRNAHQTTGSATLAYDFIPKEGVLDSIYHWEPMRRFVSDILGFDALYPYVDDVAPLNVLVYPPGKGTGWHFDIAEFVVTLLIRSPRGGGVYEYAPFIRSEDDEGFDAVGAILAGERHGVHELSQPEGALVIFKGHHTLHRVTPVEGDLRRLVGVLSYAATPGRETSAYNRRTFYGRDD